MADLEWLAAFGAEDLRKMIGEIIENPTAIGDILYEWQRSAEVSMDPDLSKRMLDANLPSGPLRVKLHFCGGPQDGHEITTDDVHPLWCFSLFGIDRPGDEVYKFREAFEKSDGSVVAFYDYDGTRWAS